MAPYVVAASHDSEAVFSVGQPMQLVEIDVFGEAGTLFAVHLPGELDDLLVRRGDDLWHGA